jgi:hypothetical protein
LGISGITVLAFGTRRVPRSLATLPTWRVDDARAGGQAIDEAVGGARRVIVLGGEADLAAVLTRLIRAELLDVEVARVRGWGGARRALRASATRVPLIRDDTGTALVGAAVWLPPGQETRIRGEAVVDDAVLFDGEVAAVRIEPTSTMPGLRAAVLGGGRRRWISGRAVQLGTTGARVVRDGIAGTREVKRSTFYRHTTGWMRVG